MIISGSILKNYIDKYRLYKKNKEHFKISKNDSAISGTNAAFLSFALVVAAIFFCLELLLLFFAINMALVCSEGGPERIVNIVLAITFTIPYVMLNILFNKCAKKSLRRKKLPSRN